MAAKWKLCPPTTADSFLWIGFPSLWTSPKTRFTMPTLRSGESTAKRGALHRMTNRRLWTIWIPSTTLKRLPLTQPRACCIGLTPELTMYAVLAWTETGCRMSKAWFQVSLGPWESWSTALRASCTTLTCRTSTRPIWPATPLGL